MLIVDVSASPEAFVKTVCVIAICRSVIPTEQRRGVLPTLPHLRQPVRPENERRTDRFDEGFRRSRNVKNQHKIKVVFLIEFSFC